MSDLASPTGRGTGRGGVSRHDGWNGGADGSPIAEDQRLGVTHRVWIDPSRSMRAVSREVEGMLGGLEEGQRQSGALLASELIAQVVSTAPGWNSQPVGLTVQLRADAARIEATGPVASAIEATGGNAAPDDPVADWGVYLIDSLADRWGLAGPSRRVIWAEIEAPA